NRSGALYNWLKEKGRNMEDCGYGSPVRTFFKNYSPPQGVLVAHANYLDDEDIKILKTNKANVVHCPSSFEYFGHKIFRFDDLIKAGVNVCLGTDSLASAKMDETVPLDMFYEMRLFSKRQISPEVIVKMATVNGAKALGWRCGSLTPGAYADLICLPYDGRQIDVYDAVVHYSGDVLFSLIDGKFVSGTEHYRKMLTNVIPS
ncbi:MAG TPA: amidohydrolase family protein, partial [Verrucomicrobiota bacterium]|nr:amidohydrolase family protein [Verrucomicrobiota bacterium]